MSSIQESVVIKASRSIVFDAYVRQIDQWWPRVGTYRYSFAQPPRHQSQICFEPWCNGRFYEIFDDGSEYEIGRILDWQPPVRLTYTWRDPRWPAHTTVAVTFQEHDGVTTVTVCHTGFGKEGIPDVSLNYGTGLAEILSTFGKWVATM